MTLIDIRKIAESVEIGFEQYRNLLSVFLRTSKEDLKVLRNAVEDGSAAKTAELGHHIKGAAVNLGLEELYTAAGGMETMGKNGDLASAREQLRMVTSIIEEIEEALLGERDEEDISS